MKEPPSTLLERIMTRTETLTQSQKAVASFLTDHLDECAFMTIQEVARSAGVSESSVVRFAYELGYTGYPHLRAALQDMMKSRLDAASRVGATGDSETPFPHRVMHMAIDSIYAAIAQNSLETMETAVDALIRARRVLTIGSRSARAIGQFFAFNLKWILPNTQIATVDPDELCEHLLSMGPGDVAMAISITRYTKRSIDALKVARGRGVTTIAVTDSFVSPLAAAADTVLIAPGSLVGYYDSFVAALCMFDALLAMTSRANPAASAKSLRELESIWGVFGLFVDSGRGQPPGPGA